MSKFDATLKRIAENIPVPGAATPNPALTPNPSTQTQSPSGNQTGAQPTATSTQGNQFNIDDIAQAIANSRDANEIKAILQPLLMKK